MHKIRILFWALILGVVCGSGASHLAEGEEFTGPFSSWRNLKTDYGAVGDGLADDTAALQRALDDLAKHQEFCVLYVPAGHYRLTSTVRTLRESHNDGGGISLVGESPEITVLQWDGPAGGTVVQYDAWYARISRLTIDGAGRAGVALGYGPAFSTYNETSDLVLRDAGIGILLGGNHGMGQAENEVVRCHFLRCRVAGLETADFNSLDIWVWYCRFEDCGHGLYNGAGAFHAWQNVFRRSTIADAGSGNLDVFSFVNNTSIGSRRFLDFDPVQRGGLPASICGNRILNATDEFPLRLGSGGPYLVMDNLLAQTTGTPRRAVKMTSAAQTLVGNTYATTNSALEAGRFLRVAETVGQAAEPKLAEPALPPTPANQHRTIIEVRRGHLESDAHAIQAALDAADQFRGQHPIVHLPMGDYKVGFTLVIPAESDVQLVGDGAASVATCLNWTGPRGGLLLKLKGPARATLKDFCLNASGARALLVENADQPDGQIFADQLNANGPTVSAGQPGVAILVNSLVQTDVLFRCLQGAGNAGGFFSVAGPPAGEVSPRQNQIAIFTGGTGTASGHYQVGNGASLVVRSVYNEHCAATAPEFLITNGGDLSLDGSVFGCLTAGSSPMVNLHDLRGGFTVATSQFIAVDSNTCRVEISGDGQSGRTLLLNDLFEEHALGVPAGSILVNHASPPARAGIIGCVTSAGRPGGFGLLNDVWQGESSPVAAGGDSPSIPAAALLAQLAPLRAARVWLPGETPAHTTDLRIYRVVARGSTGAVVEFRAGE